jgi:hypothetical protein
MPRIFISYRRDDSGDATGHICDCLTARFGQQNVFIDVDSIPFGVDFRRHLEQAVGRCNVLLAVMGEHWLETRFSEGPKKGQRRIDDPDDYVRTEIQAALARNIPVVPVLVGRATMPRAEDLPDGLKELAFRNAAEVRPGRDFRAHVERLVRGLGQRNRRRWYVGSLCGLVILLGSAVLVYHFLGRPEQPASKQENAQRAVPSQSARASRKTERATSAKGAPAEATMPPVLVEVGPPSAPQQAPRDERPADRDRRLSYEYHQENGVLHVAYRLPYLDRQRQGKPIRGMDLRFCPFLWHAPVLSIKVLNNSAQSVLLTECVAEVTSSKADLEPVLVVADRSVNSLLLVNEGWGDVVDPVLTFRFEGAASAKQHTLKLKTFSRDSVVRLTRYVPKELEDKDEASVNGKIDFGPVQRRMTVPFVTAVKFDITPGEPLPPSYAYDLALTAGKAPDTVPVAIAQNIRPGAGDQFVLRIASDKSAHYEFALTLRLIGGRQLPPQHVVLDVFVPRSVAGRGEKASKVKAAVPGTAP